MIIKVLRKTLREQELVPQLLRDPPDVKWYQQKQIQELCCVYVSAFCDHVLLKYFVFLTDSGRFVECLWVTRNWFKIHKIAATWQMLQKVLFENPVSLDILPLILLAFLYACPYFLLLLLSHFSRVGLCATPYPAAHQAPLSLGLSRQEHWSGLPFPSPMHKTETWKWSLSVVSDSSRLHGLQPTGLLRPWDFPGKSNWRGLTLPSPPLFPILILFKQWRKKRKLKGTRKLF